MLVTELLALARGKVDSKINSGAPGQTYWKAASEALLSFESRQELLEGVTDTQIRNLLVMLSLIDDTPDAQLQAISTMTADEVIESMRTGTAVLKADTAVRKQREDAFKEIGIELGMIGAKILVSVLFPVTAVV